MSQLDVIEFDDTLPVKMPKSSSNSTISTIASQSPPLSVRSRDVLKMMHKKHPQRGQIAS